MSFSNIISVFEFNDLLECSLVSIVSLMCSCTKNGLTRDLHGNKHKGAVLP